MRFAILFCLLMISSVVAAQYGYDFIRQPASTTSSALGGHVVSMTRGDQSVWFDNPALLDSTASDRFALSINPYFVDINRYVASSTVPVQRFDHLAVGVVYNDFGAFDRTDAAGNVNGTFKARSYVLQAGGNHQAGLFTLGASIKLAGLALESSRATLLLSDIGGVFRSPDQQLVIGMTIKNIGAAVSTSAGLETEPIPFDVVLGASFKPAYMPFRFTMTVYQLQGIGDRDVPESLNLDRRFSGMLRHINLATSIALGSLIDLHVGFNYRRYESLRLAFGGFGAGWSFATQLKLKTLQLMLSRASYQAAGGTTFLTLQMNYQTIKNIF